MTMMKSPSDLPAHLVKEWAVILWDNGYPIKDICVALDRALNSIRHHLQNEGRLARYVSVGRPKAVEFTRTYHTPPTPLPAALKKRLKERCVSKPKRI